MANRGCWGEKLRKIFLKNTISKKYFSKIVIKNLFIRRLGFLGYSADFSRSWWLIWAAGAKYVFAKNFPGKYNILKAFFKNCLKTFVSDILAFLGYSAHFARCWWQIFFSRSCHALNSNFYTRPDLCSGS